MSHENHVLLSTVGVLSICWALVGKAQSQTDLEDWLEKYDLLPHSNEATRAVMVLMTGCETVAECVEKWGTDNIDHLPETFLPDHVALTLHKAALETKAVLFDQWLKRHHLFDAKESFHKAGIDNLDDVRKVHIGSEPKDLKTVLETSHYQRWIDSLASFPSKKDGYRKLTVTLWEEVIAEEKETWISGGVFFVALIIIIFRNMVMTMSRNSNLQDTFGAASKLGFLSLLTGKYLSPKNCVVIFDWTDPQIVGNTVCFLVKFFQRNGQAYPVCNEDNFLIEVTQGNNKIACSIELGGNEPSDAHVAKVQFSVRHAGDYRISVLINMVNIKGSPFVKTFVPGPPDPLKTCFVHHCSTVVCSENIPSQLFIEPHDRFGNLCIVNSEDDLFQDYSVDIFEVSSSKPVMDAFSWDNFPEQSRIALTLKFEKEGCYRANVSYKGQSLQNGDFHIIVLNKEEAILVQKNVAKKNHWYESKLLALNCERFQKPKTVYCYISPKQLTIKEYMWKIIPKHLVTFRVCPSTKFHFQSRNDLQGEQILTIDDGSQSEVELISPERNVIAATFTQFLLKNIGGSETFKDKQDFFHHEVRKFHQKHFHDKLQLKINREKILESSFKATKGFNTSDWCKNFEIHFIGEEGLDWGGLRREWFELVCSILFDPQNMLFSTFKSDKQGLVHPSPSSKRPSTMKLKHYEFAGKIVGKCLYESALGSSYRQLVKAKFSRSFLAQLIGLRVHYKYFEHDDPELYVSKIKYILENDVENMGMFFVEEEYNSAGQLTAEVELMSGGSRIPVTNQNKLLYLDALAQYRLANSIKDEIEHFLKGLNELIPDNLLCIFDENELELLMCGTGHYSIADFKLNHAISGSSYEFRKVLNWFWTAVFNFTEEEMARLLQFTTGCSQLPPGGFSELTPKFHIASAHSYGDLPTAHTCFNQLCLPDYCSYEQFERALRIAINEGSEGFGMV